MEEVQGTCGSCGKDACACNAEDKGTCQCGGNCSCGSNEGTPEAPESAEAATE